MPPRVPPDRPRTPAPFVPPPIAGLATGIGLFVGTTVRGPSGVATRVVDRATFGATFGEPDGRHPLGWSIGHFFDNGGATAWVVALPVDGFATALVRSLAPGGACDAIDRFDVLCVPGLADPSTQVAVQAASAARGAFFVMDCDAGATAASLARGPDARLTGPAASSAALYAPWLLGADGAGGRRAFPPSGFVAGLYARSDAVHGVWHSPAGRDATVVGALAPVLAIDASLGATLNAAGIDAIVAFPSVGVVAWGARTLAAASADPTERYVSLRRFRMFVEASIASGLTWVAGRRNDEATWAVVRTATDAFLRGLWSRGALVGASPTQAWFVRCDRTTMSPADLDAGRTVVSIGLATTRADEFTILRIVVPRRRQVLPT